MFIELEKGMFVDKDKIECIEEVSQTKTKVYTASRSYNVTMPVGALKAIIESKNEGSAEKLLQQLITSSQTNRG